MAYSKVETEFSNYCENHEFISLSDVNDFKERLEKEDHLSTFSYHIGKFKSTICPKCAAAGFFKWNFLGKFKHTGCGYEWYSDTGTYAKKQMLDVLAFWSEMVFSPFADPKNSFMEKIGIACLMAMLSIFVVVMFRLPLALVMIIIQAIVSLTQKKPE